MADDEGSGGRVTVSELSRQLRDVLVRFEGLVRRVEDKFVSKEVFDLRVTATDKKLEELKKNIDQNVSQGDFNNLEKRVTELESDKTWLIRLVLGSIILVILGLVYAYGGGVPK